MPRVLHDVVDACLTFPTLKPKVDLFHRDDGANVNMLVLRGTIPIFVEKAQYNIPMDLWIQEQYGEVIECLDVVHSGPC